MQRQNYEMLPCGCEIWNEGPDGVEFVIRPCSLRCPSYLYAVEQSRAKGNPVEYRREA